MKKIISTIIIAFSAALPLFAQQSKKETLAITRVRATPSLVKVAEDTGRSSTMTRIIESIETNLMSAVQKTRKFEIVSRNETDMKALLEEQNLSDSGNVQTDKNSAKAGALKGAKYIVTVVLDDFQDYTEKNRFATLGKSLEQRVIRFGATAKIINSTTGSVMEVANFVETSEGVAETDITSSTSGGSKTDSQIAQLSRKMCTRMANYVADVVFPAKILAARGATVSFNRGAGSGVEVGQIYEVFALGEAMIDEDTGENLGAEEVLIGLVRVTRVNPKFSQARVLEDNGIDKGHILRLVKKDKKKTKEKEEEEDEDEI